MSKHFKEFAMQEFGRNFIWSRILTEDKMYGNGWPEAVMWLDRTIYSWSIISAVIVSYTPKFSVFGAWWHWKFEVADGEKNINTSWELTF